MSRPSNQAIERYYFDLFKSEYDLPSGELVFTDKPDVIIRGSQMLGIEIANLYISSGSDPSSEQVQNNRRLQVLDRAQVLYLASGGRNIELTADFDPQHPILDIEDLAKALAKVAHLAESLVSDRVNPKLLTHIPQVRFLYFNTIEYVDAMWRLGQCHSIPSLSIERLRLLVAEKKNKLQSYEKCYTYWLLLVVDMMNPAQEQSINWPSGEIIEESGFERILIYKTHFSEVVQIPQSKLSYKNRLSLQQYNHRTAAAVFWFGLCVRNHFIFLH